MGEFCGVAMPPWWERGGRKPECPSFKPKAELHLPKRWGGGAAITIGLDGPFAHYLEWMRDHKKEAKKEGLVDALKSLSEGTAAAELVSDWKAFLSNAVTEFKEAVRSWREECDVLLAGWRSLTDDTDGARRHAAAIFYQIQALCSITVIEALADRQFLPHYGFPIGLQKLRVVVPDERGGARVREEDQFRLERSGLMALREYVPGSQILVGGQLVTSRGLLKHWTGADLDQHLGLRGSYATCEDGHFFYQVARELTECPVCGKGPSATPRHLLIPRHGFTTAAWDSPKVAIDIERIGSVQQAAVTLASHADTKEIIRVTDLGGIRGLNAVYAESGEILVHNEGDYRKGFAICLKCGYAESEHELGQGRPGLPRGFEWHAPLNATHANRSCWHAGEASVLRNQTLAAREITDVVMLDPSSALGDVCRDPQLIKTLAIALQLAGAKMLDLDARELGAMIHPAGDKGWGFGPVVYDNIPGGAGHVRELLGAGRDWMVAARDALYVDANHNESCRTACLDCLLTFGSLDDPEEGALNRPGAMAVLDSLLNGKSQNTSHVRPAQKKASANAEAVPGNNERLRKARAKRRHR
jgi:hypothetical protein